MARPLSSTWGRTTVSFLGTALPAGADLPCSLALRAAAAPKLPPPLGSVGSPGQQCDMQLIICAGMPKFEQLESLRDLFVNISNLASLRHHSIRDEAWAFGRLLHSTQAYASLNR